MTWITRGIEGETFGAFADYEQHRHNIEEAARSNPYPFKEWFPDGNRAYIPLVDSSSSLSEKDWEIINELKGAGYAINEELYIQGYVQNRSGNKVKIGKVLKRVLEDSAKREAEQIEQSAQNSIAEGYDEAMAIEDRDTRLTKSRFYHENMMQNFVNSPARAGSGDPMMIVISQDPHDIGRMSTDRGWTSCMDLDKGAYRENVVCEVAAGSLIAYIIRASDTEVEKPLARIHIKRYEDGEGNSYAVPEDTAYGTEIEGFQEGVKKWLNERQGSLPMGFYRRKGGNYSDSLEESLFVFPDDIDVLTDMALNGIDNPQKFVIWRLIPTHMAEGYVAPGDFETDDEEIGLYTDFTEERDAIAQKAQLEEYYADEWQDYIRDEYGEYDEYDEEEMEEREIELFEIEQIVLKSEEDIMNEAAEKIIDSYGMENTPDEVIITKKNNIEHESRYKSFIKRMYFGGKKHLLEEDEIASIKASGDFGQAYAREIGELPDGPEKDAQVRELVKMATDDIDWAMSAPAEAATVNNNAPSAYRLMDVYDSAVKSFSISLFNVDRQIPQVSIEKMIDACRNAGNMYEQINTFPHVQTWSAEEFEERMIATTLTGMGNAGTDTPIAINWYKSLLDRWKPEWESEKYNYSSVNINSMGRAIAGLGPDNGQQFLPFLRERAKEAARIYAQIPETHANKHQRKMMRSVYNSYMLAIKKISPKVQASTDWFARYASDMDLK